MSTQPVLTITNATLRPGTAARLGVTGPVDVEIADGRVTAIRSSGASTGGSAGPDNTAYDAAGGLLTESFVNGHLHLCKVNTLDLVGDAALAHYHGAGMGGAITAIELASAVKRSYRADLLLPGIRRALERAVAYGVTHIRAFADVDTAARQEGIRAVMAARDEFASRVTVQAVAFPQDGVLRDPGAEAEVRTALEEGADVVGGIPWIEYTQADMAEHVTRMMDLAVEFDRDVSMLVDDAGDPSLRTLEELATQTIARGWEGRVTAQHARAMALYPDPALRRLAALLLRARIGVVSDPHTGPLHARVRDLRAAGVPVALGQDDIADAYYPFGRNNLLEVGFLAAHLLWMTGAADLEAIYDMITVEAARVLGIPDFELAVGHEANLVLHRATSVRQALAEHEPPRLVVKAGVAVCGDATGAASPMLH